MALVLDQELTDSYAVWNGDCIDVLSDIPDGSLHLTVTSPPFATARGPALYHYSSSDRDLSNSRTLDEFMDHYAFVVREIHRATMPGRMCAVHTMDVPMGNTGHGDALYDFSGDVIRLHERLGWRYAARYAVWKEPLTVRNRTLTKGLAHQTIVEDSSRCSVASADYLLVFRRSGDNPVPISHPNGLTAYAGERKPPADVLPYRNWAGKQTENRYSHWIWRQYASAFWDDVRLDRVLPFREAREEEDEKHVHPLQLDVIDRAIVLWSNPGERVFDPFGGVGSTPYSAVMAGRFGLMSELKPSYYRQAVKNLQAAAEESRAEQVDLFSMAGIAVG